MASGSGLREDVRQGESRQGLVCLAEPLAAALPLRGGLPPLVGLGPEIRLLDAAADPQRG